MSLVPSLLQAIVQLDGEALVMHVGDKPYVVSPTGQVDLATRGLSLDAVVGVVNQLLPIESQQALEEFGAAQYELPALAEFPGEQFTIVAARGGDDVWAEVRRRRISEDDRVPMELFGESAPTAPSVQPYIAATSSLRAFGRGVGAGRLGAHRGRPRGPRRRSVVPRSGQAARSRSSMSTRTPRTYGWRRCPSRDGGPLRPRPGARCGGHRRFPRGNPGNRRRARERTAACGRRVAAAPSHRVAAAGSDRRAARSRGGTCIPDARDVAARAARAAGPGLPGPAAPAAWQPPPVFRCPRLRRQRRVLRQLRRGTRPARQRPAPPVFQAPPPHEAGRRAAARAQSDSARRAAAACGAGARGPRPPAAPGGRARGIDALPVIGLAAVSARGRRHLLARWRADSRAKRCGVAAPHADAGTQRGSAAHGRRHRVDLRHRGRGPRAVHELPRSPRPGRRLPADAGALGLRRAARPVARDSGARRSNRKAS